MKAQIPWNAVEEAWSTLEGAFGPLDFGFDDENATRIAAVIDKILKAMGARESVALGRLLDSLSNWLSAYEAANVHIEKSSPVELLRHLMDANGLKQKDLSELFGGQPVVSAILNGKRRINGRQAVVLGRRFSMSPAAFLQDDELFPEFAASSLDAQSVAGISLSEKVETPLSLSSRGAFLPHAMHSAGTIFTGEQQPLRVIQ